jgi:hypothetical protein
MKTYNITLNYQQPERDMYGFPQFGEQIVELQSINQNSIYRKLDAMFGKDNYSIITIQETLDNRL